MATDSSPHDNEYMAAIAGLHEQTISPRTFAVGDFVSGITAGKRWSGRVEWVENDRMCINPGGAWLYVPVADVTH